jgi:hypothetical protein
MAGQRAKITSVGENKKTDKQFKIWAKHAKRLNDFNVLLARFIFNSARLTTLPSRPPESGALRRALR